MSIWLIILGMGAVTFAVRLSFIALLGQQTVPALARRALAFVPVAVLVALIVPDLLLVNGAYAPAWPNARLVAGLVAAAVAWRTRNALLTIGVGMATLYLIQALAR